MFQVEKGFLVFTQVQSQQKDGIGTKVLLESRRIQKQFYKKVKREKKTNRRQ
jgi:hypothetical protein